MKAVHRTLAASLLVAAVAGSAHAGAIGYRVFVQGDGAPRAVTPITVTTPGQPITVDVGTHTGGSEVFVHIFDVVTGDVPDSVGMITVRGSVQSKLFVLLAGETVAWNQIESRFNSPVNQRPAGMQGIGGLDFETQDLRDRSAVSLTVLGDIGTPEGVVTAGQIFRLDAQRTEASTGGGILCDVVATRNDWAITGIADAVAPTQFAIGVIRADWQITGDISATAEGGATYNPSDETTWASAGTITCGTVAGAPGLRGNIDCSFGLIREVISGGAIGDGPALADRSSISAGFRIGRIATVDAIDPSVVSDSPIYADVHAGVQQHESQYSRFQGGPSSLSLIQTEGDFVGKIHLYDCWLSGDSGPGTADARRGIFIGGDFYGDIVVDYGYQYADIIARSFRADPALGFGGSVWIGQTLKGAVVAVGRGDENDPLDGTMGDVTVGYAPTEGFDPPHDTGRGMAGLQNAVMPVPFEGTERDRWYTQGPQDFGGTVDSVIRAATSIGDVTISAMSNRIAYDKFARPRLEAPAIKSVSVGVMDAGVVWSGTIDSPGSTVTNSMGNDYAKITRSVVVGCMGPKADLWVYQPASSSPVLLVDVTKDVYGEIHMPSLPANQTIRVGGTFGDIQQVLAQVAPCFADASNQVYELPSANREDSPRGYWDEVEEVNVYRDPNSGSPFRGVAAYSRIILQDATSLNGQIIIDADNATGAHRLDHWLGDVVIGTGTPDAPEAPTVLSTSLARARYTTATGDQPASAVAPLYSIPSSVLGGLAAGAHGGAVGLVPFARYEADCFPPNFLTAADPASASVEEDAFAASNTAVEVAFYGPIYKDSPSSDAVDVLRVNFLDPGTFSAIPTSWWDTSVPTPRVLAIKPDAMGGSLIEGRYTLTELLGTPNNRLECDVGLGLNGPPVLETTRFDFTIGDDCGISVCLDNPFCFIADFNQDGGVDGDDPIAFFAAWDAGVSSADVNFQNGVDGDDPIAFFAWWDIGGCGN